MIGAWLYTLTRLVVDAFMMRRRDRAALEAEVLVLRRQVQVLERQIRRVHWSPDDRMLLAALRDRLPKVAWNGLLVKPATVLGWHREMVRRRWAAYGKRPRRGRPPLPTETCQLVLRLARENPSWGYFRIRGELLKLGREVAATTIRSVLIKAGIPPAGRRSELTWKQFLSAHAQTIVATDFFTVDTVFFRRLYVLVFVHLGTRRVLSAACTSRPDSAWVTQQIRNLAWKLHDEGTTLEYLIHDRDRKFPAAFDEIVRSEGGAVILTPLLAPNANAICERWIGSCRRECLDRMLIVSRRHLEVVLREYIAHYNTERPHRSLALLPPDARGDPYQAARGDTINRSERLGGLLASYSLAA